MYLKYPNSLNELRSEAALAIIHRLSQSNHLFNLHDDRMLLLIILIQLNNHIRSFFLTMTCVGNITDCCLQRKYYLEQLLKYKCKNKVDNFLVSDLKITKLYFEFGSNFVIIIRF